MCPRLPQVASAVQAPIRTLSPRAPQQLQGAPQTAWASFSPMGVSQVRLAQSLWQLQAWPVASQAFLGRVLGPWASRVEEAGAEDFQRGQSRDSKGAKAR